MDNVKALVEATTSEDLKYPGVDNDIKFTHQGLAIFRERTKEIQYAGREAPSKDVFQEQYEHFLYRDTSKWM